MGHADGLSRLSLENNSSEPWHTNAELEFVISLQEKEEEIIIGWIKNKNPLPRELQELQKHDVREENDRFL